MATHWKEAEQKHLLNVIQSYRQSIYKKEDKEAKRLTLELANTIYQHTPEIQHRTVNAIFERIPYLDNLLGGVFEKQHYAKKDRYLYAIAPRENNSKEPNLCNTRHHYNGAMQEYLKDKLWQK